MKRISFALILTFLAFLSFAQKKEPLVILAATYTLENGISFQMNEIPGGNFSISTTEVSQELYEAVMEENPSYFTGEKMPVDTVNWYDCICFCNKLSVLLGKEPVYSVNGSTNFEDWDYSPHGGSSITGEITVNKKADGFRLPSVKEWEKAASGGEDYKFAGSEELSEVAWYIKNSEYTSHEVAQKKPNAYGLYDMCGNLWEWCEDRLKEDSVHFRIKKGGCYANPPELCEISFSAHHYGSRYQPCYSYYTFGFRIAAGLSVD
ncbi:MAG: formylglycine-generating enzyme family protein [Treponema sp.]|nr:formylglycine-generating enzyme family protein [Treponema sp.]